MAKNLQLPRALKPGDIIGIAAPASPVREEYLALGEAQIVELGFRVRRAPALLARDRYTAGHAAARAGDLTSLLRDPEVRAIWCARGGYGSPHLPPLVPVDVIASDPKLLIGSSDITALLLWWQRCGVACLHGPMPAQELARGRFDRAELLAQLTTPASKTVMGPAHMRVLHPGRASGTVTGGCLSLVVASLGTKWEVESDDALLFLEDVDTKPFQIDRMLTQLRQAGKLDRVRGLLFGEMRGCVQHQDQGYSLDDVIADLTADLTIPVVVGLPCGHTSGPHHALPFGVHGSLDSSEGFVIQPAIGDEPAIV